jgi:hypothetical protein
MLAGDGMAEDVRKEFNNPKMAVSIPVSGFDGWEQTSPRRLGIIQAQYVSQVVAPKSSATDWLCSALLRPLSCSKLLILPRAAVPVCLVVVERCECDSAPGARWARDRRGDSGLLALRPGGSELPEHPAVPLWSQRGDLLSDRPDDGRGDAEDDERLRESVSGWSQRRMKGISV